ncbi:putative oxidoreductase [Planoprotostelium fungivorum]|uniref:Putative oxidoreductase n=1 Tax=Planoprotostelium fungivorum TaxID=1890364 RepID=A0A2P6NW02_9EUKA|nr:putative oxidoreductase [Planoprotostelium fungivorum]
MNSCCSKDGEHIAPASVPSHGPVGSGNEKQKLRCSRTCTLCVRKSDHETYCSPIVTARPHFWSITSSIKMKGTSFWLSPTTGYVPLSSDNIIHSKYVIVGGGISGVSCAYWFKKLGIEDDVLLLERHHTLSRGIPFHLLRQPLGLTASGATGRNGGHLWARTFVPTPAQMQNYGFEQMKRVFDLEVKNVQMIKDLIRECLDDPRYREAAEAVQFYETGGLDLVHTEEENAKLRETIDELDQLGLGRDYHHEHWNENKCQEAIGCSFSGGQYSKEASQLWPRRLVELMAEVVHDRGVRFLMNATVKSAESRGDFIDISVNENVTIRAEKIIWATNAYSQDVLPQVKDIIVPVRGQVLVTSPVHHVRLPSCARYDAEYLIHRRSDGRIIVGGMRRASPTGEVGITDDSSIQPQVSEALRRYLRESFPSLDEEGGYVIEQEWTGIMGFTSDYMPLVGTLSGTDGKQMITAGFTGHGMPRAFCCAEMVVKMAAGFIWAIQHPMRITRDDIEASVALCGPHRISRYQCLVSRALEAEDNKVTKGVHRNTESKENRGHPNHGKGDRGRKLRGKVDGATLLSVDRRYMLGENTMHMQHNLIDSEDNDDYQDYSDVEGSGNGRKKKQKTTVPTEEARKNNHKLIEQRRRQKINDKIEELRELLAPQNADGFPNKSSILESTIDSIKTLRSSYNKLANQQKHLQEEQLQLEKELGVFGIKTQAPEPPNMDKMTQNAFAQVIHAPQIPPSDLADTPFSDIANPTGLPSTYIRRSQNQFPLYMNPEDENYQTISPTLRNSNNPDKAGQESDKELLANIMKNHNNISASQLASLFGQQRKTPFEEMSGGSKG